MSVSFRLGKAGWYCVTKGSIFLGAVLFCCANDNSLSENLISERRISMVTTIDKNKRIVNGIPRFVRVAC